MGPVSGVFGLAGTGALILAQDRFFLAVRVPLTSAKVDLQNRAVLDGSPPDRNFDFIVEHACASALSEIGVRVTAADGQSRPVEPERIIVRPMHGRTKVSVRMLVDKPGLWKIQLLSLNGGKEREIGDATEISFPMQMSPRDIIESWCWWGGLLLALTNAALFVAARRAAWAWRIATDDTLVAAPLRIATFALSHVPKAQLWVLDLYFQRRKTALDEPAPFLALPLSGGVTVNQSSEMVVSPPWTNRRLWIQGDSGVGKTALFVHATNAHFRDNATAFEAFCKWGCVVVAFSARDYAGGGEDEHDPAWVLNCVRATLSKQGLQFDGENLLRRILDSGTIAIAIDGLHEAGRTKAVEAFAETFPDAPMLVTSQDAGGDKFETYRLPPDMRSFTYSLLQMYLGEPAAGVVFDRITTSGLKDAIRSAYDVRLVSDLAKADPAQSLLPSDLIGLYGAVVRKGWPDATGQKTREDQARMEAAAWRMVSERKPNEEKRRLKPEVDLDSRLLATLAGAPERERKPIRLVRRVGKDFEFVHDQMHAYLAARWFTQEGFNAAELEKMVAGSTIWADTTSARKTLWTFSAAMLDDERLVALWVRVDDRDEWNVLRIALKEEIRRRGLQYPTA